MKKLVFMALATVLASSGWAIQGSLVKKDGVVVKGDIAVTRKGDYTIKQGNASVEVAAADVDKVNVTQPKDFKAAVDNRDPGRLQKIVTEYRQLVWDREAGAVLVEVLLERKQVDKAYDVARKMVEDDKRVAYSGVMAPAYWQTLLAKGDNEKLERCLEKARKEGDRYAYAWSLILRGDIEAKAARELDGEAKMKGLRKALTDGYLRAALLYRNDAEDACCDASRRAMERCSGVFDEMGNSVYAEFMKAEAAK